MSVPTQFFGTDKLFAYTDKADSPLATIAATDINTVYTDMDNVYTSTVAIPDLTLTYATQWSFTVPGNYTELFQPGLFLMTVQSSGNGYYYVKSSSYSSPTTTVNLAFTDSYAGLYNEAIAGSQVFVDDNLPWAVSYHDSGIWDGFSVDPTYSCTYWVTEGKCHILLISTADGTSDATYKSFLLPIPAKSSDTTGPSWLVNYVKDNGTGYYGQCIAYIFGLVNLVYFTPTFGGSVWTASGSCSIAGGTGYGCGFYFNYSI